MSRPKCDGFFDSVMAKITDEIRIHVMRVVEVRISFVSDEKIVGYRNLSLSGNQP